jgi:hypothetical protein
MGTSAAESRCSIWPAARPEGYLVSEESEKSDENLLGDLSDFLRPFVSRAPAQSVPMQTMSGLLRLVQTSPLPTEGYMDHMAVDVKGQRLFISGEANKSLIVVDLKSGNVIHEVKGLGVFSKYHRYGEAR